jgi:MFS family permease
MVATGVVVLLVAIWWESRAVEPIIPLWLFRNRNTSLAVVASLFVGVALFGGTVFLSQYFQIARGQSPTVAGLLSMPLILGLVVSSLIVGRIITRTGRYKKWMVMGAVVLVAGMTLLGSLTATTPFWEISVYMVLVGLGLGATMQNLVLAVQNTVRQSELGTASATVAFFRSLGGAIGVSALGALLSHRVTDSVLSGLEKLGVPATAGASLGGIPDLQALPGPVRAVVEHAYGLATGDVFLVAAPFVAIAAVAIIAMREVPLRRTLDVEPDLDEVQIDQVGR